MKTAVSAGIRSGAADADGDKLIPALSYSHSGAPLRNEKEFHTFPANYRRHPQQSGGCRFGILIPSLCYSHSGAPLRNGKGHYGCQQARTSPLPDVLLGQAIKRGGLHWVCVEIGL